MLQLQYENTPEPSNSRTDIPSTSEQSFEMLLLNFIRNETEPTIADAPLKKRKICSGAEIITSAKYLEAKKKEIHEKEWKEKQKTEKQEKRMKDLKTRQKCKETCYKVN